MKVVILAGGKGTRLSEETVRVPKPMVTIGGWPMLWHIMKIFSHYGLHEFVICLGYKGYVIKEYFSNYMLHVCDVTLDIGRRTTEIHRNSAEPWRVTLVDTGEETLTGGRLRRVAPYLGGQTFCMTYGDGLADIDIGGLLTFHRQHGQAATVTAVSPPARFGSLQIEGDRVVDFAEKAPVSEVAINGGFFVLEPRALDRIEGDHVSWEGAPLADLARQGELMAYRHSGFWQPMDTLREKHLLEELWKAGQAPWKVWG